MTMVNQRNEEVKTEVLLPYGSEALTPSELQECLSMLCDHLGVRIVRTNATKHGATEIELRTTT